MPHARQEPHVSGLSWGVVCALIGLVLLLRQADARPPNIILILADDLGWGDLRSYGHRQAITLYLKPCTVSGPQKCSSPCYLVRPVSCRHALSFLYVPDLPPPVSCHATRAPVDRDLFSPVDPICNAQVG
jgi:hypothetical protein